MHNYSGRAEGEVRTPVTSDGLLPFLQLILGVYTLSGVSVVGLIGNVINVVIFSRLNQRQAMNVSLLAMAISDLTGLCGILFSTVCFYPAVLQSKGFPFVPQEVHIMTGTFLFIVSGFTTANLTLIISAERCLCILLPLKVKTLVTVGRIRALIVASFLWNISGKSIVFYAYRFVWKFSHRQNRTVLGTTLNENGKDVEEPSQILLNVINQYIVFVGVVILTAILVVKLRQQSKWRQASGKMTTAELSAKRDTKIAKTVCVISAIFILCYFPASVNFTSMFLIPGYYVGGSRQHLFSSVGSLVMVFMSINSSINILVYLKFNSQYRAEFCRLLGYHKRKEASATETQ